MPQQKLTDQTIMRRFRTDVSNPRAPLPSILEGKTGDEFPAEAQRPSCFGGKLTCGEAVSVCGIAGSICHATGTTCLGGFDVFLAGDGLLAEPVRSAFGVESDPLCGQVRLARPPRQSLAHPFPVYEMGSEIGRKRK